MWERDYINDERHGHETDFNRDGSISMEADWIHGVDSTVKQEEDDDEEEEEQEEAEEEEELLKSSRACCCPLAPLKIYHIVWTCMRCTRGVCF